MKCGEDFTQELDNLPQNLIYLCIGYNYKGSLDNIPNTIETLVLYEKRSSDPHILCHINYNILSDNIQNILIKRNNFNLHKILAKTKFKNKIRFYDYI